MAYHYPDQIWMLGDSMTQLSFGENGIGARLADTYARKLDVINRGYRGYNSRWASVVFKQIFPTKEQRTGQNLPRIRLLTIWLGSNDCVADWKPQHVSPMDFKRELSGIISVTRERSPETHIVLITPGPNQIKKLEAELQSFEGNSSQLGRTNKQVKLYVTATKEVGISEDVPVVDIWEPLWQAAGSRDESAFDTLMTDGVHLQDQGYKIVWDLLLNVIKTNFPELNPEQMRMDFPRWDVVDHVDPSQTLQRGEY